VGIGDITVTTVNAEIYTLISHRLKKNSPMANTVVVTLANGRANSGYIPDDASFGHETFQVLGSRLKPGCAEQSIANGLDDLVANTWQGSPYRGVRTTKSTVATVFSQTSFNWPCMSPALVSVIL